MKNAAKYVPQYFMPPEVTYDWVKKDRLEYPPVWCSVDLRDGNQALVEPMSIQEKLEFLQKWRDLYEVVRSENQCVSLKTLAIGGKDLIALGITPGPDMGELLQSLLEEVLEEPERNTREYLLERAKELKR